MAWTQSDVEALESAIRAAIANGSWQVQVMAFEDQSITLRSLAEAFELLEKMKAQVAALGSGLTKYVITSKGV